MTVAVVGAYGVGLVMRVECFPAAGETAKASSLRHSHGGKGSNQAVAAARLGADVVLFTALGDDAYAESARRLWADEGVAVEALASPKPTMVGAILVEPAGENRIVIAPGALEDLTPRWLRDHRVLLGQADVCLVSLEIPLVSAAEALRIAKAAGATTILNPAPAEALDEEVLALVDVLTPNESEARHITGMAEAGPEELARELRRRAPSTTVVITLGSDGVVLVDERGIRRIASPRVEAVDSTGAGDAFNGALAGALHDGAALTDAIAWACHAGAHAVQYREVLPSLPSRAELESFALAQESKESR